MAWYGMAWRGVAWRGVAMGGSVVWRGVAWRGAGMVCVWCGAVLLWVVCVGVARYVCSGCRCDVPAVWCCSGCSVVWRSVALCCPELS